MIRLTREPIDYHALTESVRAPHCGAVALFLGTVRDLTGEQVTVFLDYDAYAPMAEKKLAEIEAEVRRRWPVGECRHGPPPRPARRRRGERRGGGRAARTAATRSTPAASPSIRSRNSCRSGRRRTPRTEPASGSISP